MSRCADANGIVTIGQGFLDPPGEWSVDCSTCGLIAEKVSHETAEVMSAQHLEGALGPMSEIPDQETWDPDGSGPSYGCEVGGYPLPAEEPMP